jgi:6-pyruvoyltetrahydropterin/6-carboxytetrahydropterin synthase
VKILPIHNVTVEELSNWFIQQLIADKKELETNKIKDIKVKVFSGPGQSGSAAWEKNKVNTDTEELHA